MSKRCETLEADKEFANRVGAALDGGEVMQVQVPAELKVEALDMDNLYMSVNRVNQFMPGMVDSLLTLFFKGTLIKDRVKNKDGEWVVDAKGAYVTNDWYLPLSSEEKRKIFETLAKFSLTDDRLKREFGLIREVAGNNGGSINLNTLNILQLRELPQGAVDDALRLVATGGRGGVV